MDTKIIAGLLAGLKNKPGLPVFVKVRGNIVYLGNVNAIQMAGRLAAAHGIAHTYISHAKLEDGREFYIIRP